MNPRVPVNVRPASAAIAAVAVEALARGEGESLPTNAQFLAEHGIGAGTLQRALNTLASSGALATTSHGHLGRLIDHIGVSQCWQSASLPPVRMILPPGGPREIDALGQELSSQFSRMGVPYTVHHMRGGAGRVRAVRRGQHELAVVSSAAFASIAEPLPYRALPAGTYYAPGQLVVVERADHTPTAGPRRVGIDHDSPDHVAFTETYFPASTVQFVDVPFPEIPAAVLRRTIDVGLWHEAPSVIPLDLAGLTSSPADPAAFGDAWNASSAAVLVMSAQRRELRSVLDRVDVDAIVRAQDSALAGT